MGYSNYLVCEETGKYIESIYTSSGGMSTPNLVELKSFLHEHQGKELKACNEESIWDISNMCIYEHLKEYTTEDAKRFYQRRFNMELESADNTKKEEK